MEAALIIAAVVAFVWLRNERARVARTAGREMWRDPIQKWWAEAEAQCARYRNIYTSIQRGAQSDALAELEKVSRPPVPEGYDPSSDAAPIIEMREHHAVLKRASVESRKVSNALARLSSLETSFILDADVCAQVADKPWRMDSPAFQNLQRNYGELTSAYAELREYLEDWRTEF